MLGNNYERREGEGFRQWSNRTAIQLRDEGMEILRKNHPGLTDGEIIARALKADDAREKKMDGSSGLNEEIVDGQCLFFGKD